MLPTPSRLTQDRDFRRIISTGKAVYVAAARLKYVPNRRPQSRFAFVVSTKVSKFATRRNRVRRQLREIIRLRLFQIKPGYDIMISVQPQILKLSFEELRTAVAELLAKAHLQT